MIQTNAYIHVDLLVKQLLLLMSVDHTNVSKTAFTAFIYKAKVLYLEAYGGGQGYSSVARSLTLSNVELS